jgi:sigma-B regulation protein RsbU (phosphoserine phosphatase)
MPMQDTTLRYGSVEQIENLSLYRTGPALGIIEEFSVEEQTITLAPEDFVLLYTDGVTEAFSPEDDIYGEERLCQVIKTIEGLSAKGILNTIEASVNNFMGSLPASDDLTMLAVKRIP